MHLQQHARLQPRIVQGARQAHHGALDDLGSAALEGGVDRSTFGAGAAHRIARCDIGDPKLAAKGRAHKTMYARFFLQALHFLPDTGILREIGINDAAAFAWRNTKARRQAKSRHAIDDAEIDHLGAAARFLIHLVARNAEDFRRRAGMDILTTREGFA